MTGKTIYGDTPRAVKNQAGDRKDQNEMPKDPNADRFKNRGGRVNQFDFNKNQGTVAQDKQDARQMREGETPSAPQTEAERIAQLMADVRKKVQRKKRKQAAPLQPLPVASQESVDESNESTTVESAVSESAVAAEQPATTKKTAGKKRTARKSAS